MAGIASILATLFAVSGGKPYLPGDAAVAMGGRSERRRVLAEDVLHRAAGLAERAAILQGLADRGQQVLAAARHLAQLLQAALHERLVAVGLEGGEARELFALGLGI